MRGGTANRLPAREQGLSYKEIETVSIKLQIQTPVLGTIALECQSIKEMWETASFFKSLPDTCSKCQSPVVVAFKSPTTKQGKNAGKTFKFYMLRCTGTPAHELMLGQHNDDSQELFHYVGREFQAPYTNEQLQNAEYREACEHCKSTNQFHAKTCPNYTERPQEARTEPEPNKSADNTPNPVSSPTEAPAATTGQAARQSTADRVAQVQRTPIQQARDKFVRSVGDLGLSMGNVELATMLKSMLGVEIVPSPLTPEHWTTCYNLCNEYKTAAEIGGIALDANALSVMLCASGETPGARKIEQYNAAEWKAAAERAMEG